MNAADPRMSDDTPPGTPGLQRQGVTPATTDQQARAGHSETHAGHGHGDGNSSSDSSSNDSDIAQRVVHADTATGAPRPALRRQDYAHIVGWGADLDRAQRPAVPMERMPARLEHVPPREQQPAGVEVLHSIERPGITAVYGSTVPPSGVSGSMRRVAFRYSENDLRHWLLLLAADRVQMVEGVLHDLTQGRVPNVYAEMGGPAELRHNPAGAARKALVTVAVVGVGVALWRSRSRRANRLSRR